MEELVRLLRICRVEKIMLPYPVSWQLADFLRLAPTPASSEEGGCSAVKRRVVDPGGIASFRAYRRVFERLDMQVGLASLR
jgi:hypothetical protein